MKGSEHMARGAKVDNKKIAEIVASFALTNNYSETARATGVCDNTVKNIIAKQKSENAEEFAKVCEEKKEEFSEFANKLILKAMKKLDKELDKDNIAVNNLTTVIGVLYDKMRLANCESTENNKFEVNIKVVE